VANVYDHDFVGDRLIEDDVAAHGETPHIPPTNRSILLAKLRICGKPMKQFFEAFDRPFGGAGIIPSNHGEDLQQI